VKTAKQGAIDVANIAVTGITAGAYTRPLFSST
jgi:hypothetical protein